MKCYLNSHFDEGFFTTIEPFLEQQHSDTAHVATEWFDGSYGPFEVDEELYQEYQIALAVYEEYLDKLLGIFHDQHGDKI